MCLHLVYHADLILAVEAGEMDHCMCRLFPGSVKYLSALEIAVFNRFEYMEYF